MSSLGFPDESTHDVADAERGNEGGAHPELDQPSVEAPANPDSEDEAGDWLDEIPTMHSGLRIAGRPVGASPTPVAAGWRGPVAALSVASEPDSEVPPEAAPTPAAARHEPSSSEEAALAVATPATAVLQPIEGDPSDEMRDVPLGTLIFRAGLLTSDQIEQALGESIRRGMRLGEVLIERGWLDERDLGRLLAAQKGLPFADLRASDVEESVVGLLSEEAARTYSALPIRLEDDTPVIALTDPTNAAVVENLRRVLGRDFRLVVAARGALQAAIDAAYGDRSAMPSAPFLELADPSVPPAAEGPDTAEPEPLAGGVPVPLAAKSEVLAAQDAPVPSEAAGEPSGYLEPIHPAAGSEPLGADPCETPATAGELPVTQYEPRGLAYEPPAAPHEPYHAPLASYDAPAASDDAPGTPTPYEPPAAPSPGAASWAVDSVFRLCLRLKDGDHVEIGTFQSEPQAIERAKVLIGQLADSASCEWPFIGGRFLRPETIVSIDILEDRPVTWLD